MTDDDYAVPPPAEPLPVELTVVVVEPPAEPAAEPPAGPSPLPHMVEAGEPWNVINTRASHAEAMNKYAEVKEKFDTNFPTLEPAPLSELPPLPNPAAISAGRRIEPDPVKYVLDRSVGVKAKPFRR